MRRRHDIIIDGKAYKQYTARGMLFGQVAETPATPFASKRSQGATTLADSLTLSYFGMDSFHGGRGQDKARSPFAFMDSKRMITYIRDRAIPGPKPHFFDISAIATGVEYLPGDVTGLRIEAPTSGYAESFVCPGGGITATDLELYMRKSVGAGWTVDFCIYDDSGGLPNSKLAGVTVSADEFDSSWGWVKGVISDTVLTGGNTYWIVVELTLIWMAGTWYEVGADPFSRYSGSGAKKESGAWSGPIAQDLYFRINNGALLGASVSQAIEFYPSTTDYIWRTLFFAIGKGIYYSDETPEGGRATGGTSTTLQDTARTFGVDTYNTGYTLYLIGGTGKDQARDITDTTDNELTVSPAWDITPDISTLYVVRKDSPQLQASKTDFTYPITDKKVFKDKLYVAQGLGNMWTLTGESPTTTWAELSGVQGVYLCVHVNADGDLALWRTGEYNTIDCSTDGTNWSDDITVGDKQYHITGITVYAGEFIVFKEDGWYLVDLEEWKAEKIIDFSTQPERDAFKAHCEYAGELYTGKGAGTWRYTPGPDMTPVGVDRGAVEVGISGWLPAILQPITGPIGTGWGLPEVRLGRISALIGLTNFMYAGMDAGEQDGRDSSILTYNRVGWHEPIRADSADKPIRMLHFSPEISPTPRLWWGEGKTIKYANICDLSDNPYLWDLSEYIEESELETSKYDAGRIVHRKTVIACGVQSENLLEGSREIEVYYEADRSGLWVLWGTITRSPYQEIYMSASDIRGSFVDNGGFEAWPDGPSDVEPSGWTDFENVAGGTGTNNRESTNVAEGDYALRTEVSGIDPGGYKGVYQNIISKVTVGITYRVTVSVKNAAITNGRIRLEAWGNDSGLVKGLDSGNVNDEYTSYSLTFTPTGSDTYLRIRVYILAVSDGCTGTAYFDALEVERANEPVVASGSTPSVIKVDETEGMIAGHWIRIENEHRQVLSVDSGTQFTVTLPFSSRPASGSIVYGGWPVVHEIALKFRGTTDDMTEGWALCGFNGGWVPRPPREWSRTVLVEISDDAVEGRSAYKMWEDLQALADRPEPIVYEDYWGNEHNVFVLEPQLRPLAEKEGAIDKGMERAYALVRMLDVTLS